MILIKIDTNTEAFNGGYFFDEMARILRKIADSYENEKVRGSYTDKYGNRVVKIKDKL